jgi:predicted GNAT family acetyltransferase
MVATRKGHRGKGYATSAVSAVLKEILRESELALIHVLSDNPSAIRVYQKVGFRPYKTFAFIRGERIVKK